MEGVRAWGATLCGVAAALAILQFLAPKNSLGRLLELIGAAVFLCCALAPFATVNWQAALTFDMPFSTETQEQLLNETLIEQLSAPLQRAVGEEGAAALSPYGLTAKKIEAITDIGEDGGIYISKIQVELTEEQAIRRMAVMQILEQRFGVDVQIREVD